MGAVGTGAGLLYFVGGPLAHRAAERRDAALEWLPSSHVDGRDDDWDDDGDGDEEDRDEDDGDAEHTVADRR